MMKFTGAYLGKVLRINLSTKEVSVEDIPEQDFEQLLGGRGIAAKYYYNEIGPNVTPFAPENKVFFMTGPLTGVPLPSTTKLPREQYLKSGRGF